MERQIYMTSQRMMEILHEKGLVDKEKYHDLREYEWSEYYYYYVMRGNMKLIKRGGGWIKKISL